MKDRKTQGFRADAAETAALTLPDLRADQRIFDAIDWKNDERLRNAEERRRKERNRKRRTRLIAKVKKELGAKYADVLRAWLKGKNWRAAGIPKVTFWDRLKKVKIFLKA